MRRGWRTVKKAGGVVASLPGSQESAIERDEELDARDGEPAQAIVVGEGPRFTDLNRRHPLALEVR